MSQIGLHFGLSRDYDLFVLGMAGGLWTLLANLMAVHPPALEYIAGQMLTPLSKLAGAPNEGSFYTAIWGLHVSSFCAFGEQYEIARRFLNERGDVPEACLYSPPAMLNLDEEGDWLMRTESPTVLVPIKNEFRQELSRRAMEQGVKTNPLAVACELLAPDDGMYKRLMPMFASHLSTFLARTIELPA
jgi:hypothetical protein